MRLDEMLPPGTGPTDESAPELATPYELWCEGVGIHPDSPGAWDAYQRFSSPAM